MSKQQFIFQMHIMHEKSHKNSTSYLDQTDYDRFLSAVSSL